MAGALIAKAILGAIGGGFDGAAKPYNNGDTGVKAADMSATKDIGKKDVTFKSDALQNESFTEDNAKKTNTMDFDKAKKAFEDKDAYKKAFGGFQNLKLGNNVLSSDETLKKIYGDDLADSIIENFAKINAIDFTYTEEAQKEYNGENAVDDKEHIGVKAQELETNPATKGVVEDDINGNKAIDTQHLTAVNTAAIAELSRRVLTLETALQELMARGV